MAAETLAVTQANTFSAIPMLLGIDFMFSSFVTRRRISGEQIKASFAEHRACK